MGFIIECISLGKTYKRKGSAFTALSDINLKVSENEALLIRGRSGAGKSTLIHLMSGLIRPTSGKVLFDGIELGNSGNSILSEILLNKTGIIFQNFNLLPAYTVFENIELGILPKKTNSGKYREIINEYLKQFDLEGKEQLLPAELSTGQQQKVAVIRTLVREPSLIFADEPTGSVDDQSASEILEHLMNLKRQKNITLVMATHGNIPDRYADRIIELENGRIKG
ncbi:MAG TPA: ABC transporter ATP-binding protein [Bacteroidales bacterium]|nr:ABC transporter ATP-binding protein [Bacteroidales bacterium]